MKQHDVVVLGGGPAGSTAATLMAQAGLDVVVLEKEHFPRFHIGESLLPATVATFKRLGVHDRIRESYVRKPGGKWLFGEKEVPGDFNKSDYQATFKENPYSYLVERSTFDKILIDRTIEVGADVRFGTEVTDVITEDGRVVGARCQDESGKESEVRGRLVIDASGLRSIIPSKLRIRKLTEPHRLGIYAQYSGKPARSDVEAGWFVGQMFYDGWTWLLLLPEDRFSVGAVLTVDRFKKSGLSPTELLERLVAENPLLTEGMAPGHERISDVIVTGNMGNTSDVLSGEGWVTVGDAAYFIDPCYSSGVHIAMTSAEAVADLVIAQPQDAVISSSLFADYEKKMRRHEKTVHNMVDMFYIASRNTAVQWLVTTFQIGFLARKFVTFVGGDFHKNSGYIGRLHFYARAVAKLIGNNPWRTRATHPKYLHADAPTSPDDAKA